MRKHKQKAKSKRRRARGRKGNNLSIPKHLNSNDTYKWADFFELSCLVDFRGALSRGEIFDSVELELRDHIIDSTEFEGEGGLVYSLSSFPQGKKDKVRFFGDELFKMFEYRLQVYGKWYPFKVKSGLLQLKGSPTVKQKIYLYFLMCSNLNFFPEYQNKLTTEFEKISKLSLKKFVSPKAEVHHFGANVKPSKYSGHLFDKITQLGVDLNCRVTVSKNEFAKHDTGDGQLDIVAWFPFKDKNWSQVIILAQCKCSNTWVEDRFSTSLDNWGGKLHFRQPINSMTFIPFCYRRMNGVWHADHNVSGTILIDRQRLIQCLEGNVNFFSNYESYKFVSKIFKFGKKS